MTFKEYNELGIRLEEGVDLNKFLAEITLMKKENVDAINKLFLQHQYDLGVISGAFIKIYTLNNKEVAELEKVLIEIDKMGLKNIFNVNLKVGVFKIPFIERIKHCIENNIPFLNEDNTFVNALNDSLEFAQYCSNPVSEVNPQETIGEVVNTTHNMDAEDRQVYNEIMTKLSYLVLGNPTDEVLTQVVNNIKVKIVDEILRKTYRFLSIGDIVNGIMFDGIKITPLDSVRLEELISATFPSQTDERKL